MKSMLIAVATGWSAVAAAVEPESCERWDDIGTNLALPEEIAGMHMLTRAEYGKEDTSFCYGSREFVAGTDGQRVLTFYLYKRDWALVCSFMGRFLKLRYSECVADADGKARPSREP